LTPKQLIKKSFKGYFAIDRALALLESEFKKDPHVCEMLRAFMTIYRTYCYKPRKSTYSDFIKKIERRQM
jgi:hypothetical protein